jgi:hypothetical protein
MKTSILNYYLISLLGWANVSAQMIKTPAPKRG